MSSSTFSDLLHALDPRPEVRFREFERICKWYLLNVPEYHSQVRRIWQWSEWPGAWGRDAGIDLVAEQHDGGLWAIQAKLYDPAYAIKKADVDSFLSESARYDFAYRLLIATTDRLGPTARKTLDSQRQPVGYLLRSQLELAQVAWPVSPADLRPQRQARKKPLPHVREAIKATVKGFQGTDRGQLIMACGTGKTLAGLWIAARLDCTRTLVLLPSLSLLAQTLREWSANAAEPFEYLAVCSDQTVVGADEMVQHTPELGVPVTTDPDAIAAFLRRRSRRVVFATYQSTPQIATAYDRRGTPAFDLAIADEAHRCAGRIASEFATILDNQQIKSRRRLFMTATPRYFTPRVRHEAGLLDIEVASMDDETTFGPVLHRLTFGEAIARDLLSDYQVAVVGVDDETYRAWAERGEFVTLDGQKITDARTLAGEVALAKAMRKYNLRRVISFHGRVKAAAQFSAALPRVIAWMPAPKRPRGDLWSEYVSGTMTSGQRDRLLLRFRNLDNNERGLLSNARCLGEGVDVPTLDGIAFIDPRRSTTDIIQALGRAIRKAPNKTLGTVVLPVFVATADDPNQALDDSSFRHVWDVLKALPAHDDLLADELDELRRQLGARRGTLRRPAKIRLDLPTRISDEFARAFDVQLVEQTTATWDYWFGLLERYVEREGHARVSQDEEEAGYPLGRWVNTNRQLYKQGHLAHSRAERLERLPGWLWSPFEADWEEGFAHLTEYAEREAHARARVGQKANDGFAVGRWAMTQRSLYRQGRLGTNRAARLEALPGWRWNLHESSWEEGYARLNEYVVREGHALVPLEHREAAFTLGSWVGRQRRAHKRGRLERDKVVQLEAVPGWAWDRYDADWEASFTRLADYVRREGHTRIPKGHREDGLALRAWAQQQRDTHRRGALSPTCVARLEALTGWVWNPHEGKWDEGYARLLVYVAREGQASVPQRHSEAGFKLGAWVTTQRGLYAQGRLDRRRVARLEAVPGWSWNPLESGWDCGCASLLTYVEREGHARVPAAHRERGFPLGAWVANQRQRFRQGRLDAARAAQLETLRGWAWHPFDADWEDSFKRLANYVEREGNARVPSPYREDGFRLGTWVSIQRHSFREGRLDPARAVRLEALPGWVWDALRADWEDGYARLERYVGREGHARVPYDYRQDSFALGSWVSRQRRAFKQGRLDRPRTARLETLSGWSWARSGSSVAQLDGTPQ